MIIRQEILHQVAGQRFAYFAKTENQYERDIDKKVRTLSSLKIRHQGYLDRYSLDLIK